MKPVVNQFADTAMGADELIALINAAVFTEDECEREAAIKRLRARMAVIREAQLRAKGRHSNN